MFRSNNQNQATELWFRENELEQLQNQTLVRTIRLGDRSCGSADSKGGYCELQPVKLLIVREDGSFLAWQASAVIIRVEVKPIRDLQAADFQGCLNGLCSRNDLLEAFKRFYTRDFVGDELVSVITFEQKSFTTKIEEVNTMSFYRRLNELLDNELLELNDKLFELGPQFKPGPLTTELLESSPLSLIIGEHPSGYALSPIMWNAEAKLTGRQTIFLPADIKVANLGNLFKLFDLALEVGNQHFRVLTITNPHKVEAYNYLSKLALDWPGRIIISEDAKRIGATNQILIGPDNVFHVINSDGQGMANAIESFLAQDSLGRLAGHNVAVLGSGGAGRGIIYELAKRLAVDSQSSLTVFNRTLIKAEDLVSEYRVYFPGLKFEARPLSDLVGLAAKAEVVVSSLTEGDPLADSNIYRILPDKALIVDANYGANSVFAQHAKESGRTGVSIHDGAGMVVEGYRIPSGELAKLWNYHVSNDVYGQISRLFGYVPLK